jgi:hypothetical protein
MNFRENRFTTGLRRPAAAEAQRIKSFLLLFFKKEGLPLKTRRG